MTAETKETLINESLDEQLTDVLTALSVATKKLARKITENQKSKGDKSMYKNYGLAGETVNVRHKKGDTDAYPWNGIAVPILVEAEYPGFLIGLVLPHHAPGGFGLSHPYRVTLHKFDIEKGVIIINGGDIR